jgi:hypothetical protein
MKPQMHADKAGKGRGAKVVKEEATMFLLLPFSFSLSIFSYPCLSARIGG